MRCLAIVLSIVLLVCVPALAEKDLPVRDVSQAGILRGGPAVPAKANGDTARLIGPAELDPQVVGTFETPGGTPDWHGWTTKDWTAGEPADPTWHASTYHALGSLYSAYCGDETMPSCGPDDPVGGYGNQWDRFLTWRATVADTSLATNLTVDATVQVDSEQGYDYLHLVRELPGTIFESFWALSGDSTAVISIPMTYVPGEYCGAAGDEVVLSFRARSDGSASDEDCWHLGTGMARVDDVTITADNPAIEVGHDFEDGTLGPFEAGRPPAVGDFAQLKRNMRDADGCVTNASPQVVFIDDGIVQPLTGGSYATTPEYMYAGGFVVNHSGGLTFNDTFRLRNSVISPPVAWTDPAHDGALFTFSLYTHSFFQTGFAGIFGEWWVRSTDGTVEDLEHADWVHAGHVFEGGPAYWRLTADLGPYLVPDPTWVQVSLGAVDLDHFIVGGDIGSPSPYFDNVRLETFAVPGPEISARSSHLPNDAFPEIGVLDTADLGRNSVRFDMAMNLNVNNYHQFDNGDSVVIVARAARDGAALTDNPRLHYRLRRNPLFDPFRTAGLPDSGVVAMDTAYAGTGGTYPDHFMVDLPDTGFLFPGDVLHYFFSAESALGGPGGTDPRTTYLPADRSGFGDFQHPRTWNDEFTVRALPTVDESFPDTYVTPRILFWDDSESSATGIRNQWHFAFASLGLVRGEDYDVYYGKASSDFIGSGLGGRATTSLLGLYGELLYSAGDFANTTLVGNDNSDGGEDDIALLESWLDLGGKDMFLTGNYLAFDLMNSGGGTIEFLRDRLMVIFRAHSHRDLLGGQISPRVLAEPANPVLSTVSSWIANGGCPYENDFDLVEPQGAGQRLALFANADGADGGYPYSPLTLAVQPGGSRAVTMSLDLAYASTDPNEGSKAYAMQAARVRLLKDVLSFFGVSAGAAVSVPVAEAFTATNHPNPFNPVTEIAYSIEAPGHLTLKVFNLRGALVNTLIDGQVEQAGKVAWDGTDSHGGQVASGVYFYEARMGGEVRVGKMALVK